ncbi:MAG TPA: 23S rRNA (uracil(1939)-C(5))-methyltransferase RlmD [Terriglobales bacterium]|nr:23S rRNA (uracil(1939)-C(5))-methyltransferase RlmD [Terriglobales bacterium]
MQLTIEKLVYGGDGLARLEQADGKRKTVFVPLVLPGETVEVTLVEERPGFARAKLESVVEPSPSRTASPCPYFGECGGCHYQHAPYEKQLELKSSVLRETVSRIAKVDLPEITLHASPPLHYRNRTRMRLVATPSGESKFVIGYNRLASHRVLPVRECPISSPLINRALQGIWSIAATHEAPAGLAEIEFFADSTDEKLQLEFLTETSADDSTLRAFAREIADAAPAIAGISRIPRPRREHNDTTSAPELDTDITVRATALAGRPDLTYDIAEYKYRVSAGSFFQTNRHLTSKLIELVTNGANGKRALDLYAGVGLFTLPLAKSFERVTSVESAASSFRDLVANAPANVKPIESTTEAFLQKLSGSKPDFVVADPPRSGLGKRVTAALVKLQPREVACVSCDPSTLARDLPALLAAGYRIREAHLVDLFPQTFHIETVLRLVR